MPVATSHYGQYRYFFADFKWLLSKISFFSRDRLTDTTKFGGDGWNISRSRCINGKQGTWKLAEQSCALHSAINLAFVTAYPPMAIKRGDGKKIGSGAGQAARQILDEIISGGLQAGRRLYIRDLIARTGLGPTPLREGMCRLVASGLVEAVDQRGFKVTRIERSGVRDYTAFRLLLEPEALRQSIVHGDARWRAAVSSSLDAMIASSASGHEKRQDAFLRYSEAHRNFHVALISASPSRRLTANLALLFDQEKFYCHNLIAMTDPLADLMMLHSLVDHRSLAQLALEGNADAACAILAEHQWQLADKLGVRLPE